MLRHFCIHIRTGNYTNVSLAGVTSQIPAGSRADGGGTWPGRSAAAVCATKCATPRATKRSSLAARELFAGADGSRPPERLGSGGY